MIHRAVSLAPFGAVPPACLTAGFAQSAHGDVEPHAEMLRHPDVGRETVVFSYAGDLWVVDRGGRGG